MQTRLSGLTSCNFRCQSVNKYRSHRSNVWIMLGSPTCCCSSLLKINICILFYVPKAAACQTAPESKFSKPLKLHSVLSDSDEPAAGGKSAKSWKSVKKQLRGSAGWTQWSRMESKLDPSFRQSSASVVCTCSEFTMQAVGRHPPAGDLRVIRSIWWLWQQPDVPQKARTDGRTPHPELKEGKQDCRDHLSC